MELETGITKENIETLVTLFYHKAMKDEQIGHYFVLELGDDIENEEWKDHIDTLVNFWATVFLDEPLYFSDPYGPHFTIIGLKKEDFTHWIELFSQTADQVYIPEIADRFKEKGVYYSKDFIQRLSADSTVENLKSAMTWE